VPDHQEARLDTLEPPLDQDGMPCFIDCQLPGVIKFVLSANANRDTFALPTGNGLDDGIAKLRCAPGGLGSLIEPEHAPGRHFEPGSGQQLASQVFSRGGERTGPAGVMGSGDPVAQTRVVPV
jgi:hypothetical protein